MRGRFGLILALVSALAGCGDNTDRIRERASIEGQETARKQVEAENLNRDQRVEKAEADLERRRRFIDALVGTYEGTLKNERDQFRMRLKIGSSLPPYTPPNRIRSPEEVAYDLNNLFVNIQSSVLSDDGVGIGGCAYEMVRPGFENGKMTLISKECPTSYELEIADDADPDPSRSLNSSGELPGKLLAGTIREVLFLVGSSQSVFGTSFQISLRRSH